MIARTRRIATALAFAAVASSTTLSQTQFARLCGAAMRCRRPLELKNRTVILDAPHKVGAGDALAIRGPTPHRAGLRYECTGCGDFGRRGERARRFE